MTLHDLIRGTDLDTRRTFLGGMAGSLLGVGVAAALGPSAVARALTQDALASNQCLPRPN
jgi:hypothetical protein